MTVIGGRGGIIPATPGSANMAAPLRPALRAGSQTEDPTRFSIVESDSSGGRGGIISPAASSASLASPEEPRWRAWQSNCVLIPTSRSRQSRCARFWRKGWDYLACGELCEFGFARGTALARVAVKLRSHPTSRSRQSRCARFWRKGWDYLAYSASSASLASPEEPRCARGSQTAFSSHHRSLQSRCARFGGRGGIRTHGTVSCPLDFESSAFNRTQPPFPLLFKRFCGLLRNALARALPLPDAPLSWAGRVYYFVSADGAGVGGVDVIHQHQNLPSIPLTNINFCPMAISGIESALSPLQSGCAMSTPKEEEEYRKNEEQWKKIRAMSTRYFGPLQMQHSYI